MKTDSNMIVTATLPGGLRCVCINARRTGVEICGLSIKAGSRNDPSGSYGLAHFVEHTIFKGTSHRRAAHIIKRMETVGGELNAYTTKEETVIYSVFPSGNLSRAAELIGDITVGSQFPKHELDKEREVVGDEIDSYLDTPSEAVFDDFEDLIFEGSALGHNILGSADALRGFDSNSCRSFVRENYTSDRIVAFYSGSRNAEAVLKLFEKYFSSIPVNDNAACRGGEPTPVVLPPFDRRHIVATHQAHCIIGARVGSYMSDDRYATALLANIMGGPGMNSLLNVALRERRGLVYSVDATTALFSDCGLLTVYFGCDPDDAGKCRELTQRCFSQLDGWLTPKRLEAAKRQYLGQLAVSAENREAKVLSAARSLLWRDKITGSEAVTQAIRALTVADVLDAAAPMLTPSVLCFSPH